MPPIFFQTTIRTPRPARGLNVIRDRRRPFETLTVLVLLLFPLSAALADPWAAPGDARLRHDLELLSDTGLVKAPLTSWPVSWAEVGRDLSAVTADIAHPAHIDAALARVRAAVSDAGRAGEWVRDVGVAGSVEPMTLRRFADVPRGTGELVASAQYTGARFALRLQASAVGDPSDDQDVRFDGSYASVVLGNWMLSTGFVDRWWGPGWEGSLIYGTNQRPIPSITVERNYSDPFDARWLAWVGQWRLAFTLGQLEGDRGDAPHAQFLGMRVTWKPHARVEVGISRSAQWCGRGRPCSFGTLWDLLAGNDNDQPLAAQPGNQLAGFDIRWSVPWIPLAVYGQAIGEDEAGGLPSKYLGLVGAESWGGWGARSWRVHAEYADTACIFNGSQPEFGCAYRNIIYSDGYQFREQSVGHAIDGDSRQLAFGVMLVEADGSSWQLAAQNAKINRAGANPVQSVSVVPARVRSADLYHRRGLFGGDVKFGVGYEEFDSTEAGDSDNCFRGFAQWTRAVQ
ncbi:MAG: capsule assembly Wzi family protein [Gammaproteobacteria bacterium]|nr:MAG: capsule assembly Wzi family protein [Gammaproteobacteria bacterium]